MPDKVSTTRYNQAPRFFGKGRTKFDLSHPIEVTGNTGELIVTLCEPVVPGTTMSLRSASLTRLETSLHQTMDNAYVETAYFFVPARCLWQDFDKYQGYNRDPWAQTQEFKKPQYYLGYVTDDIGSNPPSGLNDWILPHSLINDLYSPITKVPAVDVYDSSYDLARDTLHVDLLPLRGVFKIYNDYFRDQNYDSEIYYDDGAQNGCVYSTFGPSASITDSYLFNGGYFNPAKDRLHVNRFKDANSTALPQPQKGDPISVLLANAQGEHQAPVGFISNESTTLTATKTLYGVSNGDAVADGSFYQSFMSSGSGFTNQQKIITDLSGVNFTINDLRIAIALQGMRERDARSGNRLNEKLYGTWHIQTNDLELDRAEYLGGKRVPVNMMEVLQTSETGTTVLGHDAGHSKTVDYDDSFVRTFQQWGYVIGFVWVRTSRSYSQGIDRKFFVEDILDEYDPMLDAISEQPKFKFELNAVYDGGTYTINRMKKAFGFQEAWYQYKERTPRFYGMFQPGIQGSLADWHYGDNYTTEDAQGNVYSVEPMAGPTWLKEGPENVDRTIAVASDASRASFQWMFNINFDLTSTFEASYHSKPNTFGF